MSIDNLKNTLMKTKAEELKTVCANLKIEATPPKAAGVGSILTWLKTQASRSVPPTETRRWVMDQWMPSAMATAMLSTARLGFLLGTCVVRDQWDSWPTLIAKPMRVANAWMVLAWDEIAVVQLLGVAAGVSMLNPYFKICNLMTHASVMWQHLIGGGEGMHA